MFLQDAHRCLETWANSGEQARGCRGALGDPPSLEDRPRHLLPHLTHLGTYGSAEARWP